MVLPDYDNLVHIKYQTKRTPPPRYLKVSCEREWLIFRRDCLTRVHRNQTPFAPEWEHTKSKWPQTLPPTDEVSGKIAGDNAEHMGKHQVCWCACRVCGHVVMRLCSCAYMGICRDTDMRQYDYMTKGYTVKGYVAI